MSQKKESTLVVASLAAASAGLVAWYLQRRKNNPHAIPLALQQSPYAAELKLAVRLALEAGDNMVSHCDQHGTVLAEGSLEMEFKGQPEDFCTAIDLLNEELVAKAIQEQFPAHCIIGEETTGKGELPTLTNNPTWIVDPIDGYVRFKLPPSCMEFSLQQLTRVS
jgi:hypothetical protein